MSIIECIPNVCEGRCLDIVNEIARIFQATPGIKLLNYSSDSSHNRSVFTAIGNPSSLEKAILNLYSFAIDAIDLRQHTGEHPRIGAIDVIPLVPLEGCTTKESVTLAKHLAKTVAKKFEIPMYLYEDAAANQDRKNIENIRRGQFEGLMKKMTQTAWAADYGPLIPHPSAGASIIGSRKLLIAYNINLKTNNIAIAKNIAAAIRSSNGGLPFVKALGVRLEHEGIVQVSTNLINCKETSLAQIFEAVSHRAARHGVSILNSEIIGLVPAEALFSINTNDLLLEHFTEDQILEKQINSDPLSLAQHFS